MTTRVRRLPVRRTDMRFNDEDTRSLVVDPVRGTTHVLNPTARAIWELCDGSTTLDELVDAICQVFSVPHGVALRDVAGVLGQLEEAGLVGWTSEDQAG
jgi:PqqD family protein of HPr-rel-A system